MEKLSTFKEIDALSTWEICKELVDDTPVYRSLGEESLCMEAFNEYVSGLQEKTKEKELKREEEKAKKEKDCEEKEKRKDREKREKDRERKHRRRHQSSVDDMGSDRDDKEEPKMSRRHGSDRKKSRKVTYCKFASCKPLEETRKFGIWYAAINLRM